MKNIRRWPRLFLGVIYLFLIYILFTIIRDEYINIDTISVSNNDSGGVVLGLSLVTEKPQTLISNFSANQQANTWSTSFLLQSQSPTTRVFLDYISLYENADQTQFCFTSFNLSKDINVPFQVISEIEDNPPGAPVDENDEEFLTDNSNMEDNNIGVLEDANYQSDEFVFLVKNLPCLEKGNKYFVPHLFLGVLSTDVYADLPLSNFPPITGYRALEFFPFEEQKITIGLDAYFNNDDGVFKIRPNLDVSISQQGWIGAFEENNDEQAVLKLSRPSFYKVILIAFALIMPILIIFLNNIIDEAGGFFEVSFGLLLGLWGTHEILIPEYVGSSVPIDVVIYILYALVIGEILTVFIDESVSKFSKRRVKITYVKKRDIDNEHVVIKNYGWFPVDMTGWTLFDQAANRFKFPVFVLQGKIPFSKERHRTVKVWTKSIPKGIKLDDRKGNLYWGKSREVWNNAQDTAHLEDEKGEAIDTYLYPNRRNGDKQI